MFFMAISLMVFWFLRPLPTPINAQDEQGLAPVQENANEDPVGVVEHTSASHE